jgi:outer membrane protein TolC
MNERARLELLFASVSLVATLAASPGAAASPGLTLRQAVDEALGRSPDVVAAESALQEGVAGVREIGSPLRPNVFATTTPGYSTGLPVGVAGELPSLVGVRLRMVLLDLNLKADRLGSEGRTAGLEASVSAARTSLVRRTAAAYARLAAAERHVAAAGRRLEAQQGLEKRTAALFREGRKTELETERAGLETARARRGLLADESERDLAAEELRRLVGLPAGAAVVLAEDPLSAVPTPEPTDAVAAALASDPSLKGLSREASLLSQAAAWEERWFKPLIQLDARYSYVPPGFDYGKYFLSFSSNVAAAGVSVVVPVLTGGREAARAFRARAQATRLEAERKVREEALALEARRADAALGSAALDVSLARRARALGEEALRVARLLAEEGRGEADDVPRAELELAGAEDEVARAEEDLVLSRLRLLAVRGELGSWGAGPASH